MRVRSRKGWGGVNVVYRVVQAGQRPAEEAGPKTATTNIKILKTYISLSLYSNVFKGSHLETDRGLPFGTTLELC